MRQASKLFAFVALSITASGCGELPASSMVVSQEVRPTEAGTTFDVDPWQRRAPHGAIKDRLSNRLDSSKVAVVLEEKRDEAVRRLESVDWTRVSAEELESFAGRRIEIGAGEIPVLLRGTTRSPSAEGDPGGDLLQVTWKGGAVIVSQICFRSPPTPPMIHSPVVAVLPGEPAIVYPSSSITFR